MNGLPGGAVTFLFTDIEGSTRLVKALRERYPQILADHRRLIRAAIAAHDGHEVDTQGDAFFVAFAGAKQAVLCALAIQRALAAHAWPADGRVRVRIGVHTGHAVPSGGMHGGWRCTGRRGSAPPRVAGRCWSPRRPSRSSPTRRSTTPGSAWSIWVSAG
jgi:hypothetical protein